MSSSYTLTNYLVTPAELSDALQKNVGSRLSTAPRVIPLCGTWFLPNDPEKRTGWQTFKACRIPKARFFDLDAVKDQDSPYPHMLPSNEDFAKAMGQLGIHRDDSVVVYDSKEQGIFSAPRVAWTLKAFGHQNVHVLNNFKLWVEEGYPTEWGEPDSVEPTDYPVPELDRSKVVDFEQVKEIAKKQGESGNADIQILDARSKGRWEGKEPEPRPGLSSGHIPSSISVPVPELLDPKTKTYLPAAELKRILEAKGIDPSKPIISSCGTGVTAAVIDAALAEAGFSEETRQVYDGSWTEWAQRVQPDEGLIVKV
ncbi:putative 3-mercaptopyruvate sulfurtransferase [Diplodia seriata]|uniref:Putative 3-mercaptopyruvate sulfurtransferase n=1 Tax=Diplodia seriata TaxID=420778 RepID=A0A1S8B465_9PEZI|nr:putative 3-mercaptopyruvate sulfurtransferase [Diplodia seriata]